MAYLPSFSRFRWTWDFQRPDFNLALAPAQKPSPPAPLPSGEGRKIAPFSAASPCRQSVPPVRVASPCRQGINSLSGNPKSAKGTKSPLVTGLESRGLSPLVQPFPLDLGLPAAGFQSCPRPRAKALTPGPSPKWRGEKDRAVQCRQPVPPVRAASPCRQPVPPGNKFPVWKPQVR